MAANLGNTEDEDELMSFGNNKGKKRLLHRGLDGKESDEDVEDAAAAAADSDGEEVGDSESQSADEDEDTIEVLPQPGFLALWYLRALSAAKNAARTGSLMATGKATQDPGRALAAPSSASIVSTGSVGMVIDLLDDDDNDEDDGSHPPVKQESNSEFIPHQVAQASSVRRSQPLSSDPAGSLKIQISNSTHSDIIIIDDD